MKQLLSPRELAEAIGVSESSLKRWTDAGELQAVRTAGGHRRIPLPEAVRFIRRTGVQLVKPHLLGLAELKAESTHPTDDPVGQFYALLRAGRAAESRGLLMALYLGGRSMAEISDGPVREAMAKLGELWLQSESGICDEHRATDICIQALNQLRSLIDVPQGAAVAVGAAGPGDPYLLGSLSATLCLRSVGIDAINLGPDTPLTAVELAAREYAARLVWLSVSREDVDRAFRESIVELADRLGGIGVRLVVGGRSPEIQRLPVVANCYIGSSMAELVAFARGVVANPAVGGEVDRRQAPATD